MTRSSALWAVALLFLASQAARAEPGWSYTWTTTTPLVGSGGSGVSILPASGSGSGTSDIVAANLAVISSAPAETPDPVNGGWNLTLHLTDNASGDSGTLLFTGQFSGTVSAGGSNVENTFNDPKIQSLPLGAHAYSVTIGLYTPPGLPGATLMGAIGANLSFSDTSPPPPTTEPPPPPPSP